MLKYVMQLYQLYSLLKRSYIFFCLHSIQVLIRIAYILTQCLSSRDSLWRIKFSSHFNICKICNNREVKTIHIWLGTHSSGRCFLRTNTMPEKLPPASWCICFRMVCVRCLLQFFIFNFLRGKLMCNNFVSLTCHQTKCYHTVLYKTDLNKLRTMDLHTQEKSNINNFSF